jgi:putative transposase
MLETASAAGTVDLCYLDESGFCQWSDSSYSYYFRGEQKRQEQTKSRGKRISILGIWQPMMAFLYTLVVGSLKSHHYVAMLNAQAEEAELERKKSGRIRVIVQDNGSIHLSKYTQKHWEEWRAKGLYLFFLPPYCSEMNPIELEWLHLKRDELAGRMFSDIPELAYHVVQGIENRAARNGHVAQFLSVEPALQIAT